MELGRGDYAKYPFLPESGKFVQMQELSISNLVDGSNDNIINRAKERIIEAAKRQEVSDKSYDYDVELLSFPVSLMLVKAANIKHFIPQYSFAEAIRVEHLMEKEKNKDLVIFIFKTMLNIPIEEVSFTSGSKLYEFRIPVVEYLKRSTKIHGEPWKLISKPVKQGYVYLNTHDLIRLIRDETSELIATKISDISIPKLPSQLEEILEEVRSYIPRPRPKLTIISPSKYPPCVMKALDLIQNGKNLPHFGRFLMATYLLKTGKTVDDIVNYFSKAPDFNERITKYQVEHVSGLKGGKISYNVPLCKTLQTHNFCFKTAECGTIKSPTQFGITRIKKG